MLLPCLHHSQLNSCLIFFPPSCVFHYVTWFFIDYLLIILSGQDGDLPREGSVLQIAETCGALLSTSLGQCQVREYPSPQSSIHYILSSLSLS